MEYRYSTWKRCKACGQVTHLTRCMMKITTAFIMYLHRHAQLPAAQHSTTSVQVAAPHFVLSSHADVPVSCHDLRCQRNPVHVIKHPSCYSFGCFAVHDGARTELTRWDQQRVVALVTEDSARVLQTYDLRSNGAAVCRGVVDDDDRVSLALDVAGRKAAVMWCNSQTGSHISIWDVGTKGEINRRAQLDEQGQRQLMRLQDNPGEGVVYVERGHPPSVFRLSDDAQHVLMRNDTSDARYRGTISVWSRQACADVLTNTSIIPAVEHSRVVEGGVEAVPVRGLDMADGLLVYGGEDALVQWVGFHRAGT